MKLQEIKDFVKELRGLSQEELALKANIDRSHLGRIERGDNNVAILSLARIAHALDTTITKLVEDAQL